MVIIKTGRESLEILGWAENIKEAKQRLYKNKYYPSDGSYFDKDGFEATYECVPNIQDAEEVLTEDFQDVMLWL